MMPSDNFKVYVISLKDARQRKQSICNRLDALGIAYELIEAVDGRLLDEQVYSHRINDAKMLLRRGFVLTKAEIGILLSHYCLWERIIACRQSYAVVLEDDAILSDDFLACVRDCVNCGYDWDMVRLSSHRSKHKILKDFGAVGHERCLSFLAKPTSDTVSYIISYSGARLLCDYCDVIRAPVDTLIDQFWKSNLLTLAVIPPPAHQLIDADSVDRNMRINHKYTMRRYDYYRYRFSVLQNSLQRYFWILRHAASFKLKKKA